MTEQKLSRYLPDPQDLAMIAAFPFIAWTNGVTVTRIGDGSKGIACRICVGRYGLKADDIDSLYKSDDELREHLHEFHGLDADA